MHYRLVHYAAQPLGALVFERRAQPVFADKPLGLWVSVDNCEDTWPDWCRSAKFGLDSLRYAHDVKLSHRAKILRIPRGEFLEAFTRRYLAKPPSWFAPMAEIFATSFINWREVASRFDGIIIAPYQWEHRNAPDTRWYFTWDCASGCIWDPAAIERITLRTETAPSH